MTQRERDLATACKISRVAAVRERIADVIESARTSGRLESVRAPFIYTAADLDAAREASRTEHATVAARARAEALTIAQAQRGQPWVLPYSAGVELARQAVPHILASHCVLHAIKSVGKLAAVFEGLDHKDSTITDAEISTVKAMSADLMTAALRFANLYGFDLETELVARVVEKNGIGFWDAPPPAEPAQLPEACDCDQDPCIKLVPPPAEPAPPVAAPEDE